MPSDRVERALTTIDHNIMLAGRFVKDMRFEDFADDERTLYAVTRCLEVISEASRRLPDQMKARHPDVPWRLIAGAGNVYRHDYDGILPRILWHTVKVQLAPLELAVRRELAQSSI
jgi:uncharacterized protein with HEPN domain